MMETDHRQNDLSDLCTTMASLTDVQECLQFLRDLCTPQELNALVGRWQVAQMLNQKVSYRKISLESGVSTATITRVARFLDQGYGGYARALEIKTKLAKDIE